MGQVFCRMNLIDCCTKPMRFLGVQKPIRHSFKRLRNDCFVSALDLGDADIVGRREGETVDGDDDVQTTGRLVFSKETGVHHEYVNFPFLTDEKLSEWIVQTRFMIILRGPPGSGKSYIASCIKTRFPTAEICSSDDFWHSGPGNREYLFDQSRLEEAHDNCRKRAEEAASRGVSPLVIDCTNIRAYEVRVYTELARRFDFNSIIVAPRTPWRFDVDKLAEMTVHRVPLEEIRWKVRQFEPVYPLYYGWFWAGVKSCNPVAVHAREGGREYPRKETERMVSDAYADFRSILEVPHARTQLALACGLDPTIDPEELSTYWHSSVVPDFGPPPSRSGVKATRPHITVMFAASGKAAGVSKYAEKRAVSEALLGALRTVHVVGLFVTKRTVGLRIQLAGKEVLELWNSDDDAPVAPDSPSVSRPKGCRAHATLALAPGVQALETGLDVLRIFDAESSGKPDASQVPLSQGVLREIVLTPSIPTTSPEHVFYYQFRNAREEQLIYSGYY